MSTLRTLLESARDALAAEAAGAGDDECRARCPEQQDYTEIARLLAPHTAHPSIGERVRELVQVLEIVAEGDLSPLASQHLADSWARHADALIANATQED